MPAQPILEADKLSSFTSSHLERTFHHRMNERFWIDFDGMGLRP
jgi:hypothetical protein